MRTRVKLKLLLRNHARRKSFAYKTLISLYHEYFVAREGNQAHEVHLISPSEHRENLGTRKRD